jgi:hypothetical protein
VDSPGGEPSAWVVSRNREGATTMISLATFSWLLLVLTPFQSNEAAPAPDRTPAEVHIGHVMDGINGTPGGVGLLSILSEEAEIAARHAGLALSDPSQLDAMQTHVRHVRHAIDPTTEAKGPGKGYGVVKAAESVETHIHLAMKSKGTTENIEKHGKHVSTSARNVVNWSKMILAESEKVLAATSPKDAETAAQRIEELTRFILEGTDANKDGRVSWDAGEGGIAQMKQHMELLRAGEATPST